MLILGADTTGREGSIALVQCDPGSLRTLELVSLAGGTFSAQLVPQIAELLRKQNITKANIDAFAVASGPGSFTGLRVGLAAIKALAEILQKPIAAVSMLEAVAVAGEVGGHVFAALDAGRGEIYCGKYEITSGLPHASKDAKGGGISSAISITQQLLSQQEFLTFASSGQVVTPDAKIAAISRQHALSTTLIDPPKADVIAGLGFAKIRAGETISPEALDANYIRRSDAEIKKLVHT